MKIKKIKNKSHVVVEYFLDGQLISLAEVSRAIYKDSLGLKARYAGVLRPIAVRQGLHVIQHHSKTIKRYTVKS